MCRRIFIGVLLITLLGVSFQQSSSTIAQGGRAMITADNASKIAALKTLKVDTKTGIGVSHVTLSPDNKLIGLAMLDFTARVLNADSGDELLVFRGHTLAVNAVAFDPKGNHLVTASNDRKIIMWNIRTGTLDATMGPARAVVNCLAFSPNGKWMASGSGDSLVSLWNADTGDREKVFTGHTSGVLSVAFSQDSKILASTGTDKGIRLWDVDAKTAIKTLPSTSSGLMSLAFSPDRLLAAGERGFPRSRVYLWDIDSGQMVGKLEGVGGQLATLAFSPDGSLLAAGVGSATVELWDMATKQKIGAVSLPKADAGAIVNSMQFSRDGTLLVWAATPNQVNIWGIP